MSKEGNSMKLVFDENGKLVSEKSSEDTSGNFQAEQKILGGVDRLKIGTGKNAIPIGESILGGTGATIVSEIISGVIPQNLGGGIVEPIVRLVGSIFVLNLMKPILGQGSTDIGKAFVTFDAVRDLLPIDQFISGIASPLRMGNSFGAENPPVPASAYSGTNPQADLNVWLNS